MWKDVRLRVSSTTLTPDEISGLLGLRPTEAALAGGLTSPRNPKSRVRTKNLWFLESPTNGEASIGDKIEALIAIVDARQELFETLARESTIDVVVACEVPPQLGFEVTREQIRRLGACGIALAFSLYGTGG